MKLSSINEKIRNIFKRDAGDTLKYVPRFALRYTGYVFIFSALYLLPLFFFPENEFVYQLSKMGLVYVIILIIPLGILSRMKAILCIPILVTALLIAQAQAVQHILEGSSLVGTPLESFKALPGTLYLVLISGLLRYYMIDRYTVDIAANIEPPSQTREEKKINKQTKKEAARLKKAEAKAKKQQAKG